MDEPEEFNDGPREADTVESDEIEAVARELDAQVQVAEGVDPSPRNRQAVAQGRLTERRFMAAHLHYGKGMRLHDVAAELMNLGYTKDGGGEINRNLVAQDLHIVRRWWKDQAVSNYEEHRGELLAKVDSLEKEARDQYRAACDRNDERSKPTWWQKQMEAVMRKATLLGIDVSTKLEIQEINDGKNRVARRLVLAGPRQ